MLAMLQCAQFRMCTSLVPRAMTVVFGLGTRLHVRMRTRLENGVLRNGQQLGSAVNSFFDQGKFEAMKMLSGCEAANCDKHHFHAKIKVGTRAVFELSLFDKWSEQKCHFCYRTLLCLTVFLQGFWATVLALI